MTDSMNNTSVFIKKAVKEVLPPILLLLYRYLVRFFAKQKSFKSWWKKHPKTNLPNDLIQMVDYFMTTPSYKKCSKYWNWLNIRNIEQISNDGYQNFRQTVSKNYFTWIGKLNSPYSTNLIKNIEDLSVDVPCNEVLKKHSGFTLEESIFYNIVTILLYDHVCRMGGKKYIQILEEPIEGNPPFILIGGKRISSDILNSILEFLSVTAGCNLNQVSSILELGAGSARTAYCMMRLMGDIKYFIIDIPPALFISQAYLSKALKDKKIFSFRPFESFKDVQNELRSSDIAFLMPDQLYLLPDRMIDLSIAIDCLHEMKKEQVNIYFNQIGRLANHFYFKCWNETTVPLDDIKYSFKDYPVKNNWNQVFKKECHVPSTYFETLYQINKK